MNALVAVALVAMALTTTIATTTVVGEGGEKRPAQTRKFRRRRMWGSQSRPGQARRMQVRTNVGVFLNWVIICDGAIGSTAIRPH